MLETDLYEAYIETKLFKKGVSFDDYKKAFLSSKDGSNIILECNIINVDEITNSP